MDRLSRMDASSSMTPNQVRPFMSNSVTYDGYQ
jgi:hypothetical protein